MQVTRHRGLITGHDSRVDMMLAPRYQVRHDPVESPVHVLAAARTRGVVSRNSALLASFSTDARYSQKPYGRGMGSGRRTADAVAVVVVAVPTMTGTAVVLDVPEQVESKQWICVCLTALAVMLVHRCSNCEIVHGSSSRAA